jgi:hypothetical protein
MIIKRICNKGVKMKILKFKVNINTKFVVSVKNYRINKLFLHHRLWRNKDFTKDIFGIKPTLGLLQVHPIADLVYFEDYQPIKSEMLKIIRDLI